MNFTENIRFLYEKQSCHALDISHALGVIDKQIIDSKKLNFKSSNIFLEFFVHPSASGFESSDVNIGRHITGFEQQVFDELSYKDYTAISEKYESVELGESWIIFFDSLKLAIPNSVEKWRLSISEDFSDVTVSFSIS
jgi:hypothetical protein